MNNRAGQQVQSTDSCPEIKTTQKLYIKQKLKSAKKEKIHTKYIVWRKNTYKHNILLTLLNKSRLFIDDAKKLGRMQY